ncbi:hypothetical protein K474DRAFT_1714380 [Panus rudis PR-1116 ss-1]|nr:hypothetical protein K474DRAFT_1714380 [Panus rudis PR-1116 ss-1]
MRLCAWSAFSSHSPRSKISRLRTLSYGSSPQGAGPRTMSLKRKERPSLRCRPTPPCICTVYPRAQSRLCAHSTIAYPLFPQATGPTSLACRPSPTAQRKHPSSLDRQRSFAVTVLAVWTLTRRPASAYSRFPWRWQFLPPS